jgi:hypothetical protein
MQALKAILEGSIQTLDLTHPDNLKIIWPLPRDPKIDFHVVLTELLKTNGLEFINVVTEPTFQPSLLHDKNGHWTAVIAVTRGSDAAHRYGIGEQVALFINDGSGKMVDVTQNVLNAIPMGTPVDFYAQAAESTVHLDIFSINTQMSEQLYLFVKLALFAAEKPYFIESLGYLDVLRVDGRDEVSGIDYSGGTHILASRSLTYRTTTLEYLSATLDLVNVIQATFTAQTAQPGKPLAKVVAVTALDTVTVDDASLISGGMALFIGTQFTSVTGVDGNTLTVGPLETWASVGDAVVGISSAQQSGDVPAGS